MDSVDTAAYHRWISISEKESLPDPASARSQIGAWPERPVISIVMPVFNPKPAHLEAALESALGQVYPHWELCIADDASTDGHVRDVLEAYQKKSGRIRAFFRSENGGISAASNTTHSPPAM